MVTFLLIWLICGFVSFIIDLVLAYQVHGKIHFKDLLRIFWFLFTGCIMLIMIILSLLFEKGKNN
jgi:hypothetical protein